MDITPKDQTEQKALDIGQRISAAIGIIIAMGSALLAAFGDVKWISDNLPLLGAGVGALATGGLTAYVAVRRMRIDRIASKAPLILLLLLPLILAGCAIVSGNAGESRYVGLAFGEKASSTLAGLNITETQTAKGQVVTERGVGVDTAGAAGEADIGKILGKLLLLGLQSQGLPVKAPAGDTAADVADPAPSAEPAASSAADGESTAEVAYSLDGYGGSPGASGVGVYGRPSCSRCRAYLSAHPDNAVINIDDASNRSSLWSALRARGYTGSSVALPVVVTDTAYTLAAK